MSSLQGFLNSKEGQEQLNSIMSMFGGNGSAPSPGGNSSAAEPVSSETNGNNADGGNSQTDFSSVIAMLSSMLGGNGNENEAQSAPNIDINTIVKLQQVFQSLNKKDKNTELLLCLKPHFSKERQLKIDRAISMMRLFSMLPAIKESGLFSGL